MPSTAKLTMPFCEGMSNLSVGLKVFTPWVAARDQIWKMPKTAIRIVVMLRRVPFLLFVSKVPLDRLQDLALVMVITLLRYYFSH